MLLVSFEGVRPDSLFFLLQAWLQTVRYPQECAEIPSKVITDTLRLV